MINCIVAYVLTGIVFLILKAWMTHILTDHEKKIMNQIIHDILTDPLNIRRNK